MVVAGNLVAASAAGYALAKLDFAGKRIAFAAVMARMMVPLTATFVPQFIVIVNLGLVDTLPASRCRASPCRSRCSSCGSTRHAIPDELLEAARIDGAGEFRIFFGIFLPLTGPALATITIMSFLASWNNFIWPLVVAQSTAHVHPAGRARRHQPGGAERHRLRAAARRRARRDAAGARALPACSATSCRASRRRECGEACGRSAGLVPRFMHRVLLRAPMRSSHTVEDADARG